MSRGVDPRRPTSAAERAEELARIFAASTAFGTCTAVNAAAVPEGERALLDHHGHMTVAMERVHGPVTLRVVAEREADRRYCREILLAAGDGRVVQYGIVRIDLNAVPAAVAAAIRGREIPLGRILVDAGLLCDVQDVRLLRIEPGPHLVGVTGARGAMHGRVAEIRVAGRQTVELLEVVVPA